MKAEASRSSNPAEGEVSTTGSPTVEMPVSPDENNGSPHLEVAGLQGKMDAGPDLHAQLTMLSGPLTASEITTGPLGALGPQRKPARSWLPVIPGLSLDDRLGRLALSIVLALLLWFYVLNLENPEQTTNFKGLTIEVRGTGSDLKVINPLPTVDSVVQAPQNTMSTLNQADIKPYVDLTGLTEGVHEMQVRVDINGGRASAAQVSLSPRVVQVQLQAQTSTLQTVVAQTVGTPAFGYALEPPQVEPGQVRVTGSKDVISRIAQVVAPVDVEAKAGTQSGFKTPAALDAAGKELTGLTFEPATVRVSVPIKLLFNYKVVPVRVPVLGQPAPGYRVTAITINPTNVTVCCRPEVLEPLSSLGTAPLTITGTTSTVTATKELILPQGVELYPGQKRTVEVTVSFERLLTTLQLSVAPTVEGLADGFSAVVSPNRIDLVLSGTFSQLQSLSPTDIRIFVAMNGRGPGTYELQPQIILPEGVILQRTTPEKITVTITAPTPVPPTPTPTAPPTPQPTASVRQPTLALPTQTLTVAVPTLALRAATPTLPPLHSTATALPTQTLASSQTTLPVPSVVTPVMSVTPVTPITGPPGVPPQVSP